MKEWLASLPPIPVTTLILYIFATVISLLLLGYFGHLVRKSWRRLDELELKDRFAARNDFIKTTAQILGGAFFLMTIYFTYMNISLSQSNLLLTQEKNLTDLYIKAIEQLGSYKLQVQMGGIYALERIAMQSPLDHWPIMEVLTAYVREKAPWPPEELAVARTKRHWAGPKQKVTLPPEKEETEGKGGAAVKPAPDIQAVLTVLGRTAFPFAQPGENRRLDLLATNLEGAEMPFADLSRADLRFANLRKAVFYAAILQQALLWESNLQGVDLRGADLQKADLRGSNLQGGNLAGANLEGAFLSEVNFQGVDLSSANLQGADLRGSNLQGAKLVEANLQGTFLSESNFHGVDLSSANLQGAYLRGFNLQGANLAGANLQGASLSESNLQEVGLSYANLQGADLHGSNLEKANLSGAKLLGAFLWGVNLNGAILKRAELNGAFFKFQKPKVNIFAPQGKKEVQGLTAEQLNESSWDETTQWPEGFNPPAPRREPKKGGRL